MSAEVQESSKKGKGSKQKKMTVRVDFTPMVDMNMLLITFFMLCTTLSKPQTMEISMPSSGVKSTPYSSPIFSNTAFMSGCLSRLINIFPCGSTRI